jgi:hypothetical protein
MKGYCLLPLLVAACGSRQRPAVSNNASSAAVTTLPGPCVDAKRDAGDRLLAHFDMQPNARDGFLAGLAPSKQLDLDGDGTPDLIFATSPAATPWSVLYVVRGSCAHFVGEAAGTIVGTSSRSAGWLDLEARVEHDGEATGSAGSTRRTQLHFDGTGYRAR